MLDWLKSHIHLPNTHSDTKLIALSQSGDTKAFEQLYIRYLDSMYRYIYYKVNRDTMLAEDLTETVFLKAWQSLPHFKLDGGYPRAWLYKIAHNTVIDHYRTSKPVSRFALDSDQYPSNASIEEHFEGKERETHLQKALLSLTDEQREAVILRFIENIPSKEVAVILQKNDDAVRALTHRGLEKLREILGDNYGLI